MMLLDRDPRLIILLAVLLMVAGVVFPWLMVLHILRSTWFLNFASYTASVLGVILGIVGMAVYTRKRTR